MQAIKLRIQGDYYDSYLYAGVLYLWTTDGDIITLEWNRFIQDLVGSKLPEKLRFVAYATFIDNSHLYHEKWRLLFADKEFRELFDKRLKELYESDLTFSLDDLDSYIKTRENLFPFPHSDALIYNRRIYIAGKSGVSTSPQSSLRTRPINFIDSSVLNMAVHSRTLACAAGQDGVFEYNLPPETDFSSLLDKKRLKQQETSPSNSVRWMYDNLFSSFYQKGLFLEFAKLNKKQKKEQQDDVEIQHNSVKERLHSETLFSTVMSQDSEIVWGVEDKLCLAGKNFIEVLKYLPNSDGNIEQFRSIGQIPLGDANPNDIGDTVSADSSYFGYVIEKDEALIVIESDFDINSDKKPFMLPGEPTNWRLFPNSINYTNQLHVIYDEEISIVSFNQDYFLNQDKKVAGISK